MSQYEQKVLQRKGDERFESLVEKKNRNEKQIYELPVPPLLVTVELRSFIDSCYTNCSKRGQTAPPADRIIYLQHVNEVLCLNWVKTFRFISNKNWCQSIKKTAQLQRHRLKLHINPYWAAFKAHLISAVLPIFQKNDAISLHLVTQQAWMMKVAHLDQFSALWLQQWTRCGQQAPHESLWRWNSPAHFRNLSGFSIPEMSAEAKFDITHFCHPACRWWGRWWCPSAGPSTAPWTSGGRLGTPACPSAGSEHRSGRSLSRDSPQAGWEARRPESGLSPSAIFAHLQKVLKGNRILPFSSRGEWLDFTAWSI